MGGMVFRGLRKLLIAVSLLRRGKGEEVAGEEIIILLARELVSK
jgi:hypothetical protein